MDKRGATVTRELFVTELREEDSGLVECLVLQDDEDDGLVVMSSSASLSVLRKWKKRGEERGERK